MALSWLIWYWIGVWGAAKPLPPPVVHSLSAEGIRTSGRFTTEALVQDIFVGGACRNVSRIRAIGNAKGIGYFEQGGSSIGIERGIVLATGPIGNAEGPNSKGDEGGDFKDATGDPDLRKLTSAPIFDAVGLEFNFVPLDTLVTFRYVFASEEYCEFVGSNYNDVFGFFISGPGINGPFGNNSRNVALIPGGEEYVSINNINHKSNSGYFVRNEPKKDAERCQIDWKEPPNFDLTEFDGFTKALTATLRLIPCETYTLRLVIADVSDGNYDSAVFLEAESFNIGGNINLAVGSADGRDTLLEGCNTGYFLARRRPGEKNDQPLTIGLRVSDASKATPGKDFLPLPRSITIPAGANEARVPIQLVIDEEQEAVESVVLELDFPCACISDTARLYIKDPPLLRSGLKDTEICIGDTLRLEALPEGGVPPYRYAWSAVDTAAFLRIAPKTDTIITLSLTDSCGRNHIRRISVKRRPPPVLFLSARQSVCRGDTAAIPIAFSGQPPFSFVYSIGSSKKDTVKNIKEYSYVLKTKEEGIVNISAFRDGLCDGQVRGGAEVLHYNLNTIVRAGNLSCAGVNDGKIDLEVSGGTAPYRFTWQGRSWQGNRVTGLSAGEYVVAISDSNRCATEVRIRIKEPPPLKPVAFDCRDLRSSFLVLSASGGVPPYSYSVDGSRFIDQSLFDQLTPGQSYQLYTRDAEGCSIVQTFLMPARYSQMVELAPSVLLDLGQKFRMETRLNIPLSLVGALEWSPATHLSCADCLQPVLTALENETLLLKVTDVFGCFDGASIIVKINRQAAVYIPNAFSPDGDGVNDRLSVFADPAQISRVQSFKVFNRWGHLLYVAGDYPVNAEHIGWDGRFRGELQEPGVYTYHAVLELSDGNVVVKEGSFMLIH